MFERLIPLASIRQRVRVSSGGESENTPPPTSSNVNFSEWNDTNPCFHCGKCCSNVTLELSLIGKTSDAFGELLPYVKNPDDPYESLHEVPEEPGIYFVIGKRGYYLCIRGDCPELQSDGSCRIHKGKRPRGCVTSDLDSIKCITSNKNGA